MLEQEHRQRVRLLPGRAAGDPHPDAVVERLRRHERGDDLRLERRPSVGLTKEERHVDQQVTHERVELTRVFPKVSEIGLEIVEVHQAHPALDASSKRVAFVPSEVMSHARTHEGDDRLDIRALLRVVRARSALEVWVPHVPRKGVGHLCDRQHQVDELRRHRAGGHAFVRGCLRALHHRETPGGGDRPQAEGPVRPRAAQDDGDRALSLRVGEAAKEAIDRQMYVGLGGVRHADLLVDERDVRARRRGVDVVAFERGLVAQLCDRHPRVGAEQLRRQAHPIGREVLDYDERGADRLGDALDELDERLESAGRRADADHRDRRYGRASVARRAAGARVLAVLIRRVRRTVAWGRGAGRHPYLPCERCRVVRGLG